MPDAKTSLDWDGEYDDLGGGHASLRLSRDGKLRLSMSSQRIHETEAGTLEATAQPNQISRNKSNQLTAELIITDPEVTDPTKAGTHPPNKNRSLIRAFETRTPNATLAKAGLTVSTVVPRCQRVNPTNEIHDHRTFSFSPPPAASTGEIFTTLLEKTGLKIESIHSRAAASQIPLLV